MIRRIAGWTAGWYFCLMLASPESVFLLVYAYVLGLLTAAAKVYAR